MSTTDEQRLCRSGSPPADLGGFGYLLTTGPVGEILESAPPVTIASMVQDLQTPAGGAEGNTEWEKHR